MSDDRIKLVEEITKSKGYKIALFSTFNFDINYFERAILNKLYDKGINNISLFVDSDEFEKSLNKIDKKSNFQLGKKYIVSPIDIRGAFHPKVVLLLGEKKAKVIVASSNITTSGYERNNEVFNSIEYTDKDKAYQDIVVHAIDFFTNVNGISYGLDNDLIKECKDFFYYSKNVENEDRRFIDNMDVPIIDKLKEYIQEEVQEINVMVPYYDSDVSALNKIRDIFVEAKITLYIQQGTSTFPEEFKEYYNIKIFDGFNDTGSLNSGFYHGKVFLFKTKTKDYIAYGSANCSRNALFKTYRDSGNVECDFLDIGENGEFDSFFDCINIIEGEPIKTRLADNEPFESKNFKFIYAETNKDGVICHIKYRGCSVEDIKYEEVSLDFEMIEGVIQVYIENDKVENIPYIFDLDIYSNKEKCTIRCWVIDKYSIGVNRKDLDDQDFLEEFTMDSDGEKYREDRLKILKAELMCSDDILEHRKMKAMINQQQILDEEDDESDDDFIVDTEMHYEYKKKLRKYESIARIRGLYLHYFLYPREYKENHDKSNTDNDEEKKKVEKKPRKATSEEVKFERFVKHRVKGILAQDFVNMVSVEHYISLVRVIVDVFSKYTYEHNVEDIFKPDYVIETMSAFIMRILSKEVDDSEEFKQLNEKIIIWAVSVILENHNLIVSKVNSADDYRLNLMNTNLLKKLEEKYIIRGKLTDIIEGVLNPDLNIDYWKIVSYSLDDAISYVDGLYGFKDMRKLEDFINTRYDENSRISVENKIISVEVFTEDISSCFRPDTIVLKELFAYIRNENNEIDRIVIIVNNKNRFLNGKNYAVRIEYKVTVNYKKCKRIIYYANGNKVEDPYKTISF